MQSNTRENAYYQLNNLDKVEISAIKSLIITTQYSKGAENLKKKKPNCVKSVDKNQMKLCHEQSLN